MKATPNQESGKRAATVTKPVYFVASYFPIPLGDGRFLQLGVNTAVGYHTTSAASHNQRHIEEQYEAICAEWPVARRYASIMQAPVCLHSDTETHTVVRECAGE
jgi:hypothetical protein